MQGEKGPETWEKSQRNSRDLRRAQVNFMRDCVRLSVFTKLEGFVVIHICQLLEVAVKDFVSWSQTGSRPKDEKESESASCCTSRTFRAPCPPQKALPCQSQNQKWSRQAEMPCSEAKLGQNQCANTRRATGNKCPQSLESAHMVQQEQRETRNYTTGVTMAQCYVIFSWISGLLHRVESIPDTDNRLRSLRLRQVTGHSGEPNTSFPLVIVLNWFLMTFCYIHRLLNQLSPEKCPYTADGH